MNGTERTARPRPEQFDHYSPYLREMVVHLKKTNNRFSYRYFSRLAGFSSPNFLKLVAEGQRNLTPASIPKFARGLALNDRERDAFETLVMMSLAKTDEERNRYFARLRRFGKSRGTVHRLQGAEYDLYSLWYVLPIRELLLHPDFTEDTGWIARRLYPRIKPSEAKKALSILEKTGLAKRDEDGRLRPADVKISTGPQVRSLAVRNFHRGMLELAASSLDGVAQDERDITSCTLNVTEEQYQQLRLHAQRFREEILEILGDAPPSGERSEVYQLAIQMFPLTRKDS